MTSAPRKRLFARSAVVLPLAPLSACCSSGREILIAGTSPKITPVSNDNPMVKASTRASSLISLTLRKVSSRGVRRCKRSTPHKAKSTPHNPLSMASVKLSVKSLPHNAPTSSAQRQTNRNLSASGSRARKQQIRRVDTRQQKHKSDCPQEHEQCAARPRIDSSVVEFGKFRAPPGAVRFFLIEPLRQMALIAV